MSLYPMGALHQVMMQLEALPGARRGQGQHADPKLINHHSLGPLHPALGQPVSQADWGLSTS